MKISPYIIYLEMQPNALLLRQNFDSQKVSVTQWSAGEAAGEGMQRAAHRGLDGAP
jgi:hypothetical protein